MEFTPEKLSSMNNNPLYNAIGISVEDAGGGKARSRLRPNKDFCWPFEEQPHGGVLFTLMDTTMAWAVLTLLDEDHTCATINLDIQYTRRALGGLFVCHALVTRLGGQIAYTRADILDKEEGLVATGQGSFYIIKSRV
jgi:acyl-CoA thioesterase